MEITLPEHYWEGIDAMAEALLDKWLVEPGERVTAGQPLAQAVLVKARLDIDAPAGGRIGRLLVAEGASFTRGQTLTTLEPGP
ncbi:MAG: biotin/lipoyl-containing protein [Lautropia sp.]